MSVTARSEKLLIRLTAAGAKSLMWRALSLHSNNFSILASFKENSVRSYFWLSMLGTENTLDVSCLFEKNETSWMKKVPFVQRFSCPDIQRAFTVHSLTSNLKTAKNGSAFFHRIEAQIVRESLLCLLCQPFFLIYAAMETRSEREEVVNALSRVCGTKYSRHGEVECEKLRKIVVCWS